MNYQEFQQFMNAVYAAFPEVRDAVKFSCDGAEGMRETHRTWFRVLSKYSLDECMEILDGWIDGSISMFGTDAKKRIVFVVRDEIQRLREGSKKRSYADGEAFERERNKRRQDYQPTAMGLLDVRQAYLRGLEIKQDVIKGRIDENESRRLIAALVESVG